MFITLEEYPDYKIYTDGTIINPRGKTLTVWKDKANYCFITMKNIHDEYKKVRLHRIVATAFIPNNCDLPEVNHKDGDKTNNSVENLEWVTSKGNKDHAWNIGLYSNKTENHYAAVLTNTQVHQICELLEKGINNSVIADKFVIDKSIVAHIKAGDTWKDISSLYNINRKMKPRKCKKDIHEVCKHIAEGKSISDIISILPMFNRKDISRIMNKSTHKKISDFYFS